MLFFIAINIVLPVYDEIEVRIKESRASAHDVTAGIFKAIVTEIRQRSNAGSTMVIGSSVVSLPIWKCDIPLVKPGGRLNLQRSAWLERYLTERNALKDEVVNASLSGAFVSDQFLLVDKLCMDKQKPALLIYGIVPRDFMDSCLSGYSRTPIFHLLVGPSDVFRLSNLLFTCFQEKADFILSKACYMFDHRGIFQHKFNSRLTDIANSIAGSTSETKDKPLKFDPKNPLAFYDRKALWARSIKEYTSRYSYFNVAQFEKQKEFLNALITLCSERNIELVLVNMPLTKDNTDLMPKDLYRLYHEFISEVARKRDVPLIDLQGHGQYTDSDFVDTAHLNEKGGAKFLAMVGDLIIERQKQGSARAFVASIGKKTH